MEYINHIGKYTDSQAVADALEAGTLASPYVVQIDGSIYYDNYPEPEPEPATMGTWSDDGEGHYTFQITETDIDYGSPWTQEGGVQIAELYGVIYDGGTTDMAVKLGYNDNGFWTVDITDGGSDHPSSDDLFQVEGEPQTWESGVQGAEGDSYSTIYVDWNGSDSLTFYSASSDNPISIGTIDPEYPE